MKIHTEFFQGENKYRNGNGEINKNQLREDYRKFLTANSLPWEYKIEELVSSAKLYQGPLEKKRIQEDNDFYVGLINAQSWN